MSRETAPVQPWPRIAALAVCGVLAGVAPARTDDLAPRVSGPARTVFDWSTDRCAEWDIPDAPARAWRVAGGRVRMISGADPNRASEGPDLDHLEHRCGILHAGARADDPAAYDDRTWIASVFTPDGRTVLALGHVEYQGHRRPDRCPEAAYAACWRNAVVELRSRDGGRTFHRTEGPGDLVAVLPYRYDGDAGRRSGYFNPSNILERDGHLYVFVFAEATGVQKRGPCLLRRPLSGSARDWRAWDGSGFTVRFVDPYREDAADAAAHACTPVEGIGSTISTVVRHAGSGRYLALTAAARTGADGAARTGIWWTTSPDLVHWSEPALLLDLPLLWRRDCTAPDAYAYPSLLDAGSASANFDTINDTFWLYLVRMPLRAGCRVGPERDLVRFPVSWPAR